MLYRKEQEVKRGRQNSAVFHYQFRISIWYLLFMYLWLSACMCGCVWSWWTERQRPSQGFAIMGVGNALKLSASLSLSEECRTPAIRQKLKPRISLPRGEKIRTRQAKFSMDWGMVGFQDRESGLGNNVIQTLGDHNWDTRLEPVWQQHERMLRPTMLGAHSLPSSYLS